MTESKAQQGRRQRVEPCIYSRTGANGKDQFEIGWRDSQGRQRWRRVEGGIMAARKALADEHAKRARGERPSADPRLKFNDAAGQVVRGSRRAEHAAEHGRRLPERARAPECLTSAVRGSLTSLLATWLRLSQSSGP